MSTQLNVSFPTKSDDVYFGKSLYLEMKFLPKMCVFRAFSLKMFHFDET